MQAVYVWLFSCFSTHVSLIFHFFIYLSVLFSKKVKFSLNSLNRISKVYQRHNKGALQEMQYVCQCGTRKNKQHSAKAGLNSMHNNDMATVRFWHFSVNVVHFKRCVLFSNHAISRLYITRNLESIVSLTRVIIPSFTLYFYVSFCLLFA